MKKNILIWLAAITIALFTIGCLSTGDPMEDIVVTRVQNIEEEVLNADYTGIPQEELPFIIVEVENLGKDLLTLVHTVMPDATEIAFTERQFLKEEYRSTTDISQVINLTIAYLDPDTGDPVIDTQGIATTVGGIASTLFPEIAPFLPILGLFPWFARKRSRKHLIEAVKKAAPTDGTINISGALTSTAKAFGWTHSTSDPTELEKIANEIKIEEAASNGDLEVLTNALKAKGKS